MGKEGKNRRKLGQLVARLISGGGSGVSGGLLGALLRYGRSSAEDILCPS